MTVALNLMLHTTKTAATNSLVHAYVRSTAFCKRKRHGSYSLFSASKNGRDFEEL